MNRPLALPEPPSQTILQTRAILLLKASLQAARDAAPKEPTVVVLTQGVTEAVRAIAAEGIDLYGLNDELMDDALAAAFGWLIAAGPSRLHPMSTCAATRIERFIKRALIAADAARQALDAAGAQGRAP